MSTPDPDPAASSGPRRMPVELAVALALAGGALTALQSRINGELARRLDDPYTAAVISFGSGLLVLVVALALVPGGRAGLGRLRDALRSRRLHWWMLLGGVAGAWFVLTQGLSAAVIGVALFSVAIVAGQTVGGVVFDLVGLGPGGRRRPSAPRIAGAALALIAVAWAGSGAAVGDVPVLLLVFPFVAGIGSSWQQAVNGRVRHEASSALTATFVNFTVGTTVLLVAMLVHAASAGLPTALPAHPWLYAGGVIGCVFIALQTVLVRVVGVLVLALCGVAGQLVAALALDVFAPAASGGVDAATVGATALALVAVLVAALRPRRFRPRA